MKNDYVISKVKEVMGLTEYRTSEIIVKVLGRDPGIKEWQVIDALSHILQTNGMKLTIDRKWKLV